MKIEGIEFDGWWEYYMPSEYMEKKDSDIIFNNKPYTTCDIWMSKDEILEIRYIDGYRLYLAIPHRSEWISNIFYHLMPAFAKSIEEIKDIVDKFYIEYNKQKEKNNENEKKIKLLNNIFDKYSLQELENRLK